VNLYSALSCSKLHLESAQIWPVCNKGITLCYLLHTNHTSLYSPVAKHYRPLAGTHCTYPRRDGQAELAWVAGYILR